MVQSDKQKFSRHQTQTNAQHTSSRSTLLIYHCQQLQLCQSWQYQHGAHLASAPCRHPLSIFFLDHWANIGKWGKCTPHLTYFTQKKIFKGKLSVITQMLFNSVAIQPHFFLHSLWRTHSHELEGVLVAQEDQFLLAFLRLSWGIKKGIWKHTFFNQSHTLNKKCKCFIKWYSKGWTKSLPAISHTTDTCMKMNK